MTTHKCYKVYPTLGSDVPGWQHSEDPCVCSCAGCLEFTRMKTLPEISEEEISEVQHLLDNTIPGPWKWMQFPGFGAENFIVCFPTATEKKVVACVKNAGSYDGIRFMAWCRDGVPRLLAKIESLNAELHSLKGTK